jgi:anti-sigma factor RsiW
MRNRSDNEISMKVSREVILDLLPLYIAGEASPQTSALVEEYLKHDAELQGQVNRDGMKNLRPAPASEAALPVELELRSLRRTRSMLRWQRVAYSWALALTIASFGGVGYIDSGHAAFQFIMRDYPRVFWPCFLLAVQCWIWYFVLRWRLRVTKLQ